MKHAQRLMGRTKRMTARQTNVRHIGRVSDKGAHMALDALADAWSFGYDQTRWTPVGADGFLQLMRRPRAPRSKLAASRFRQSGTLAHDCLRVQIKNIIRTFDADSFN
jgi:hypothetical protein